ncbi:MAG: Rep family protein [Nesterenkonia sp.]
MGKSGQRKPSYITFSQDLVPDYWPGWEPALIESGDVRAIGEEILRRYEVAAGGEAAGFWIIKHDQDLDAEGNPRLDHVHVIIDQGQSKLHCIQIDQAMGWSPKRVVRAPKRGGRISNAQGYLIHAKDPQKHQYGVDEVVTLRGLDYVEVEAEHRDAWARRAVMDRKAAVPQKEWAELGDALVQRVLDGEVDELDILKDKTLGDIYARNQQRIDLALKFQAKREMRSEVEKLRAEVFQKTIVWAMGARNQGKTYLAESLAGELEDRLGWDIFRATAKNGPDDYNGQQVFLLNEPGPKVMEWADFLGLLDPRNASPLSARYMNKGVVAPRVIIIAVSVDPVEFGFFMPGKRSTDDSMDQLLWRISLLVEAKKIDDKPHYWISRMGEVEPYVRKVEIPPVAGIRKWEHLRLGYGKTETTEPVAHGEALGMVLGELAERSPDVQVLPATSEPEPVTASV